MTFQKSESLHVIDSFMETTDTHFTKDCSLDPSRPALLLIDVQPNRPKTSELPALAFGSHYSVFKERPGTHHYCRCWCRVLRRTVPDGLLRWKVSFGCRMTLGVIPTGGLLYQARGVPSTDLLDANDNFASHRPAQCPRL